jgi:hypothetical protein
VFLHLAVFVSPVVVQRFTMGREAMAVERDGGLFIVTDGHGISNKFKLFLSSIY